MQIVVEIDDNLYTRLSDNGVDNYDDAVDMAKAIRKGIPLPKGHGDLIDRSEVEKLDDKLCNTECGCCALNGCFYDEARTIIEADT